jgi:hypothetical protein
MNPPQIRRHNDPALKGGGRSDTTTEVEGIKQPRFLAADDSKKVNPPEKTSRACST